MAEKVLLDVLESYLQAWTQQHNDKNQKVFDNYKVGEFLCGISASWPRTSALILAPTNYFHKLCGWNIFYFNWLKYANYVD